MIPLLNAFYVAQDELTWCRNSLGGHGFRLLGGVHGELLAPKSGVQKGSPRIAFPFAFPADDGLHDYGAGALDGWIEPLLLPHHKLGNQCPSVVFDLPSQ